jgi:hypothetical protein
MQRMEQERTEQECSLLDLTHKYALMPMPSTLYTGMPPSAMDPLRVHREHALRAYAEIQND